MKSIRLRVVIATLLLCPLVAGLGLQVYWYSTEVPEGFERMSFAAFSEKAMINDADHQRVNPAIQNLDGKHLFVKGYFAKTITLSVLGGRPKCQKSSRSG